MSVELGALKEGIDDMDKKIEKMQKKTIGLLLMVVEQV